MLKFVFVLIGGIALASLTACMALKERSQAKDARVLDEGTIPEGYRDWKLISVAREEGNLDDIRAILGNDTVINAYRQGKRPFPEGSIIARLAWAYVPSEVNNKSFGRNQSFVPGHPKNGIQFMVKDSTRYASTGGWRYLQFEGDKPITDQAMLQSCFTCHQAVKNDDFVFTQYAP